MARRRVTDEEVRQALLGPGAEVIEEYLADKYSPTCLIFGMTVRGRVLHIQVSNAAVIVTVYEPDPGRWDDTFKRRRG
jgi:hypothetical protein